MENSEKKQELYPKNGEVTFLMPNTNAIGVLKKAQKGRSLTAKYMTVEDWQSEKGKEKLCYFLGFKESVDASGEVYYLAKLHDGDTPFVAAQTILVQSLANIPVGQGVSITCTDVVKNSKSGKTALFDVVELDVNLMGRDDE
ncbi:MAG: hypothetical protein KDC74_10115 [Flavobacteriaceae bacterium]|nr:hypothetical protein [Flavobacteriaceae bacterium]